MFNFLKEMKSKYDNYQKERFLRHIQEMNNQEEAHTFFRRLFLQSSYEKYQEDRFLKEPWIEHFFVIRSEKPINNSDSEFIEKLEKWHTTVLNWVSVPCEEIETIGKSVTIWSNKADRLPQEYNRVLQFAPQGKKTYFTLIRFLDITKNKKRNYKFSPRQSLMMDEICKSITRNLLWMTRITQSGELKTLVTGVEEEVFIHEFDELQYRSYSLSERAKLFSTYPELDQKLFGPMNFKDFAMWIIAKQNDSPAMKRNAERTRKILARITEKREEKKEKLLHGKKNQAR